MNKPKNVAFLIYDGVEVLDLNGPLDVFIKANTLSPGSYNYYLVSDTKATIKTEVDADSIQLKYTFDDCPTPDIIVVPGANPDIVMHYLTNTNCIDNHIAWIVKNHTTGALLFTICTGSLLVSNTSLFKGKKK